MESHRGDSESSIVSFSNKLQSNQLFEDDLLPNGHEPQKPPQPQTPSTSRSVASTENNNSDNIVVTVKHRSWGVLFANIVNIYKNGKPVDRMGLALSILSDNVSGNLILFTKNSQTMSRTHLKPHGNTIHMQDNYVHFSDDKKCDWTLRFVYEQDENKFVNTMTSHNWPLKQHSARWETDGSVQQRHHYREDQREYRVNHTDNPREHHIDQHKDHSRMHHGHSHSCDDHRHLRDNEEQRQEAPQPPQPKPMSSTYREALRRHFSKIGCEYNPIKEQEQNPQEDVIVTPMSRPIGSSTTSNTVASLQEAPSECSTSVVLATESNGQSMELESDATRKPQPLKLTAEAAEDRVLDWEEIILKANKEIRDLHRELKTLDQNLNDFKSASITALGQVLASDDDLDTKKEILHLHTELKTLDKNLNDLKTTPISVLQLVLASNDDLGNNKKILDLCRELKTLDQNLNDLKTTPITFLMKLLASNDDIGMGMAANEIQCDHFASLVRALRDAHAHDL